MDTLDVSAILKSLTLREKISLLAGKSDWETIAVPKKGVPAVRFTDGPNGARGSSFVESTTAACFPAASCIAATFDESLARRIGGALAEETQSKGARCLLGPTICLHRHPLGGRNFESFSEDPLLTGKMAIQVVKGLQERGVSATPKHFAANEQETQRLTVDTLVDERTLRELYLRPFEMVVKEARPWAIMTSYNKVNGEHADSNQYLLQEVLRGDWEYQGFVVSDWGGTNSTAEAINAGLDLEMPGPTRWRKHEDVLAAINAGTITEQAIDERVLSFLKFLNRLRCLGDSAIPAEKSIDKPEHRALIREAGANGIVLLKNDGNILPLTRERMKNKKIAVLGLAKTALAHGGGSASVAAHYKVCPWDALLEAFDENVELRYAKGADTRRYLPPMKDNITGLDGNKGLTYKRYELGNPVAIEIKHAHPDSFVSVFASVHFRDCEVGLEGVFTVPESADYYFSCAGIGPSRLVINGNIVCEQKENYPDAMGFMFGGAFSNEVKIHLEYGKMHNILIHTMPPMARDDTKADMGLLEGHVGLQVGFMPAKERDMNHVTEAEQVARWADLAIVFTGNEPQWETEGKDQDGFNLPNNGSQDRLISAVAAVNSNTIVVNSTGVPIAMPWEGQIRGILQAWFPGQECGNAIVDVLTGVVSPEGHLPCSYPNRLEDCPAYGNFPGEVIKGKRVVTYKEGIFIGYRHFDRLSADKVRFPFGFGLSYTSFDFADLRITKERTDGSFQVSVNVVNTGLVAGGVAVQVYIGNETNSPENPLKQLAAFQKVHVDSGQEKKAVLHVKLRDIAFFSEKNSHWVLSAGRYRFIVGRSAADIAIETVVALKEMTWPI